MEEYNLVPYLKLAAVLFGVAIPPLLYYFWKVNLDILKELRKEDLPKSGLEKDLEDMFCNFD